MKLKYLLIGICVLLIAEPAQALRCGSKLVNDGDHKSKILKYCGEPTSVQVRTIVRGYTSISDRRHRRISSRGYDDIYPAHGEILVEEWTYNFGPRRFMRTITFENGLVVAVKQLRSGYRE
jgi:hypothetical protein